MQTFYLWDIADTLIIEKWSARKSGQPSFHAYIESLGYDLRTITPREYEHCYERPYKEGFYELTPNEGFKEVLTWTKNNGVFTTGNPEQIEWRSDQIKQKFGFDIREYVKEVYSTFDFGNTNVKTKSMLAEIIKKKTFEGFNRIVYTDNNDKNCTFFLTAVEGINACAYHILNDKSGIAGVNENFFRVGSLLILLNNEKLVKGK